MSNGGSISGYLFADFDFTNDRGTINENQKGPFRLPDGAQMELASGAQVLDINVLDNDPTFDDGWQDTPRAIPPNQFLRDDVTAADTNGNIISVTQGSVLEVEFTLTATPVGGGPTIDLLFVAAGPEENVGDLTMVVSTAPLTPGLVYDLQFKSDGGGTPYNNIICFARGTHILTPAGNVPVEELRIGDLVATLDSGPRPIIWAAQRALLFPDASEQPVCVRTDAFGCGQPFADLHVSPQHCLLRQDPANGLLFGQPDVLISAKDVLGLPGVEQTRGAPLVEYFHFMFDAHEVVMANGLPAESFFPGPYGRSTLGGPAHAALVSLYPELVDPKAPSPFPPARPRLSSFEGNVARSYRTRTPPPNSVHAARHRPLEPAAQM